MESRGEKQGRVPSTLKTYVSMLFQIKGTIRGKDITIFNLSCTKRGNRGNVTPPNFGNGETQYMCVCVCEI